MIDMYNYNSIIRHATDRSQTCGSVSVRLQGAGSARTPALQRSAHPDIRTCLHEGLGVQTEAERSGLDNPAVGKNPPNHAGRNGDPAHALVRAVGRL